MAGLLKKIVFSLFMAMAALTFPSFSNAETGKDTENNPYSEMVASVKYEPIRGVESVPGKVEIIKSDSTYKYRGFSLVRWKFQAAPKI